MKTILLAGPSGSGKTTLARALCYLDQRAVLSTSAYLRTRFPNRDLSQVGDQLDLDEPDWAFRLAYNHPDSPNLVVDAIRSLQQKMGFLNARSYTDVVLVNVECPTGVCYNRMVERARGDQLRQLPFDEFRFQDPDYTWRSDIVPLSSAIRDIGLLSGTGYADVIIGGQYGSEGKGKLAALLAPDFDILVRSGGPNAGHWVRDSGAGYEFCFHQVPSGALANKKAAIFIAAGATLDSVAFWTEVEKTGVASRLLVDDNVVMIEESDRASESKMVDMIGSTAQGVGRAAARRLLRDMSNPPILASDQEKFQPHRGHVAGRIDVAISGGSRVLLEGTQGSALSLFHGPYPFCTSRDTNVSGLCSEVGIPPQSVRNTWMVVRTMPIRVGGNSGPMRSETTWDRVATRAGLDPTTLRQRELTSTTKRQRRVGEFDAVQFMDAIGLNRPTRLFLTFADYLTPAARFVREWHKLPTEVRKFVDLLEDESGVPVAGVSTGSDQADVCLKRSYL